MRARISLAACAAIAVATTMTVLAQTPATSQPPTAQDKNASAKSITVTGCVQRASESPTGTSGTTAASAGKDMKFILAHASLSASGTAGTAGTTTPATAIASEYKLDVDDAKLTPHVGHKVELTGMVEQPMRTEQKPTASAANAPTLKVDNVKMVATTCP